jgi:4-aminobutyrate aminotransferase-like enzyme
MDLPDIGSMSSTHSANPLVCASGHANLQSLIEDGYIENSYTLGLKFHEELQKIRMQFPSSISSVEGKGLLAALIFVDNNGVPLSKLCDRISELCLQRGLLVVHTGRESIKLAPPLCITEEAMLEGIAVFRQSISDALRSK